MAAIGLTSQAHVVVAIVIIVLSLLLLIFIIVRNGKLRAYETRKLLINKEDLEEAIRHHVDQKVWTKPSSPPQPDMEPASEPMPSGSSRPSSQDAGQPSRPDSVPKVRRRFASTPFRNPETQVRNIHHLVTLPGRSKIEKGSLQSTTASKLSKSFGSSRDRFWANLFHHSTT